jgi:hypothetical protein
MWHRQRARTAAVNTCRHYDVVPVESSVTGELLAQLCADCGDQLAAGFTPPRLGESLFGGLTAYWTDAAAALVSAGFDPDEALDAVGQRR